MSSARGADMDRFANRREAGQLLARELAEYANRSDVIVLALPRGGVPVAYEVAIALHAALDVFVVRKIGAPWNEEFAIGAVASGGTRVLDQSVIQQMQIPREEVERIAASEMKELERRERLYRGTRPWPDLRGRLVIIVDDGLATGASMMAAVRAIRDQAPRKVVVATPVASTEAYEAMRAVTDACVVLVVPDRLYGVGMYYDDFSQTTDAEVLTLLERAAAQPAPTTIY